MTDRPNLIRIRDPDDLRIAAFRHIRERDLVGRQGFIAEGTVVVGQLLGSSRFAAESLLVLENRLAGLETILAAVPASVPIHVVDRATFDGIAGFPVHRGVMASGRVVARPEAEDDERLAAIARAGGTVVVAVGIANHDNIGAIFRNAAAFGAGMVLVDATSCDPLYRKAIRVSVGSVLTLPFTRVASGLAAASRLSALGFACFALSPGGTSGMEAFAGEGAVALFLGAEGLGLDDAVMAMMRTVRIPMTPGFDSLNVATSAAIALHALYAARCGGAV